MKKTLSAILAILILASSTFMGFANDDYDTVIIAKPQDHVVTVTLEKPASPAPSENSSSDDTDYAKPINTETYTRDTQSTPSTENDNIVVISKPKKPNTYEPQKTEPEKEVTPPKAPTIEYEPLKPIPAPKDTTVIINEPETPAYEYTPSEIKHIGKPEKNDPIIVKYSNSEEVPEPQEPQETQEKIITVNATVKTTTGNVTVSGESHVDKANAAIDLVNAERKAAGLKPLIYDPRIADATLLRALESSIYWSHDRPDGTDWYTVSNIVNGENLAKGYQTAEDAMVGWMNSKGHRENILRSNFTRICIVCVKTDSGWFWVQLFGV